jgi:glycosyltransferase involved in cell wall biosynthesis
MKVRLVATGGEEDCGIATYTTSLQEALNVETDRTVLKLRSTNVLHYVRKAIKAGRADTDIIHVQHEYGIYGPKSIASWPFLLVLWLFSTVRSVPVVVTLHTAWNQETIDPPLVRLKRLYVHLNNRLIAAVADHLVFLSENACEMFEDDVVHPSVTVMPHGVQTDTHNFSDAKAEFGYEKEDTVVVLPGFVRPQKGYGTFLDIAEGLPEVEFLIAGGTQDESHESYAREIRESAPPNVNMTGVLDDERFHTGFAAADLVVLPYESVTQSGILNWCIAYELPVVASDREYFRDFRAECNGIEIFKSTNDAIDAVGSLADDPHRRKAMAQEMVKYRKANSMDAVADDHRSLYRQL